MIRLAQLPGDEVKNSVAEFFLMALYNYLIRQPQIHTGSARLAVLDEAWRLVESPFLEPADARGPSVRPRRRDRDRSSPPTCPTAVAGSTATKLYF